MLKYFLKRLLFSIPTLLAISMVVFGILALAPGDPMGEFAANPAITEAVRENIRKSLGLDQPLPVRYVKWLLAFLQGDMGYSFTSRSPVFTLIWQRLPTTLWMGIPLVVKVGQQWSSRNGYTLMMNAGITEGIAWSDEEYVQWGIKLGLDKNLREEVRWKLRKSRHTSPLWNAKQFTRDLENAYRQMWNIYCQS